MASDMTNSPSQAVEAAVQQLMGFAHDLCNANVVCSAHVEKESYWAHDKKREEVKAGLESALRAALTSQQEVAAPVGDESAMSNTKRKKLLDQMRRCGGRPTKKHSEDGPRLIVSAEDLERFIAASRAPVAVGVEPDWKHWCETCEGAGYYDATLGSDSQLANPKQECPDCDGKGYWIPRATQPAGAGGSVGASREQDEQAMAMILEHAIPGPLLHAAPAQKGVPVAEPVAWRVRIRDRTSGTLGDWRHIDREPTGPIDENFEVEPLYTHPAPDQATPAPSVPAGGEVETLRSALQELHDRCVEVKAALDKDIPDGEPVHPQSSRLTWPLSTASMALRKCPATQPPTPQDAAPAAALGIGSIVRFEGETFKVVCNGDIPGTFDLHVHPRGRPGDQWRNVPASVVQPTPGQADQVSVVGVTDAAEWAHDPILQLMGNNCLCKRCIADRAASPAGEGKL